MVKAYLKYVPQDVLGSLSSELSNIAILNLNGRLYIVCASNELVSLIDYKKGHVIHKIFDKDALFGQVSSIKVGED